MATVDAWQRCDCWALMYAFNRNLYLAERLLINHSSSAIQIKSELSTFENKKNSRIEGKLPDVNSDMHHDPLLMIPWTVFVAVGGQGKRSRLTYFFSLVMVLSIIIHEFDITRRKNYVHGLEGNSPQSCIRRLLGL